jgi:myo-inositol-1(or 4)-monophosphatase
MESEELRKIAVRAVKEASEELRKRYGEESLLEVVGEHEGDVSRRADKLSEEIVIKKLEEEGVKALVVSEESKPKGDGDLVALLDPLDGSTNYVLGIPWCSVSLAFYRKGSNLLSPLSGAVANIWKGDIYSFSEMDAFVNESRISDMKVNNKLNVIYLYLDNPNEVREINDLLNKFGKVKIRSLGSSSLDIIMVSLGKGVAFIDLRGKLRNVDIASSLGFAMKSKLEIEIDGGYVIEKMQKINKVLIYRK